MQGREAMAAGWYEEEDDLEAKVGAAFYLAIVEILMYYSIGMNRGRPFSGSAVSLLFSTILTCSWKT